MKTHELKIWPRFFDDVINGTKRYEIRVNDREYKRGDRLILNEWDPETREFTGRSREAGVVHITYCDTLPTLLMGYVCVMGIELLP